MDRNHLSDADWDRLRRLAPEEYERLRAEEGEHEASGASDATARATARWRDASDLVGHAKAALERAERRLHAARQHLDEAQRSESANADELKAALDDEERTRRARRDETD